jgi:hypothetical protein
VEQAVSTASSNRAKGWALWRIMGSGDLSVR